MQALPRIYAFAEQERFLGWQHCSPTRLSSNPSHVHEQHRLMHSTKEPRCARTLRRVSCHGMLALKSAGEPRQAHWCIVHQVQSQTRLTTHREIAPAKNQQRRLQHATVKDRHRTRVPRSWHMHKNLTCTKHSPAMHLWVCMQRAHLECKYACLLLLPVHAASMPIPQSANST